MRYIFQHRNCSCLNIPHFSDFNVSCVSIPSSSYVSYRKYFFVQPKSSLIKFERYWNLKDTIKMYYAGNLNLLHRFSPSNVELKLIIIMLGCFLLCIRPKMVILQHFQISVQYSRKLFFSL